MRQSDRDVAITLNKSGTSGVSINYFAYPGEHPVSDFSHVADDWRIKGFGVTGSYPHLSSPRSSAII